MNLQKIGSVVSSILQQLYKVGQVLKATSDLYNVHNAVTTISPDGPHLGCYRENPRGKYVSALTNSSLTRIHINPVLTSLLSSYISFSFDTSRTYTGSQSHLLTGCRERFLNNLGDRPHI